MTIQSVRDLVAWQRALDLTEAVYRATDSWPRREIFGFTDQVRRSAVSVMANIAEGQGRSGPREFLHHLSIADGSLAEVESHLMLARRLTYVDDETLNPMLLQIEQTRRPLRGLVRSLR